MNKPVTTFYGPDGAWAAPAGTVVVHQVTGIVGKVQAYYPPGVWRGRDGTEPAIDEWCVELSTGDVLLWRPENFTVLSAAEVELLGGAAAGVEALFKGMFAQAKKNSVPFGRALELVGIAMRAQLAGIERAAAEASTKATVATDSGDVPTSR